MPRIGLFLILSLFAGVSYSGIKTFATYQTAYDSATILVNRGYGSCVQWPGEPDSCTACDLTQFADKIEVYKCDCGNWEGELCNRYVWTSGEENPNYQAPCPDAGTFATATFNLGVDGDAPAGSFSLDGCGAILHNGMCGYNEAGEYGCTGVVEYTGEDITDLPEIFSDAPPADPGCIAGSDGSQICVEESEPDCGTVNGESFCVSDIPNQNCIYTDNGYKVCTGDAPSNITGEEQPIQELFDQNGNNTADIYDNSTTINEGDTTNNYGGNDSTTVPDQGFDTGEAETVEEYETECDPLTQDCGSFSPPGLSDVPTLGKSASNMIERIENAAILREIRQITSTIPTGTCSEYTFSLGFTDVSMIEHCTLFEQIRGPLSIILTGIWGFAAVRLFLMA
jgi:hypothetical protein